VAEILESKYNAVIMEHSNHNRYDLLVKIKGLPVTFEVKEDFMCKQTGNVSLEYECRGKPSGVSVSEADYYIYIIHTKDDEVEYVMFKTGDLKDKITSKMYFRDITGGDKGSNTKNYLFKYDIFIMGGKKIQP
jgi:hypothetical protein